MMIRTGIQRLKLMCLLLVLLFATTGCFAKQEIKIGVVGTMTGPNSDLSVSGRRGVEMAVDEINAKGGILGRLITLVVKDDKNDKLIANKVDHEFLKENIKIIIGHYTSEMLTSTIDFTTENKMLLLGPTISTDLLAFKNDYFIRFVSSTEEEAEKLVDYIKTKKYKNFIIIFDERNTAFAYPFISNFSLLFAKYMGFAPEVIPYNPQNQVSQDNFIEKIDLSEAQGVLILASAEDCAKVSHQLKIKIPNVDLYGPLWANTPELIKKGGLSVNEMIVVNAITSDNVDDMFIKFNTNYFNRYGDQPSYSAIYSYEAMNVLAESIEKANSLDTLLVKSKMIEISEFDGVLGHIGINKFGDVNRKYILSKISNGSLVRVE